MFHFAKLYFSILTDVLQNVAKYLKLENVLFFSFFKSQL